MKGGWHLFNGLGEVINGHAYSHLLVLTVAVRREFHDAATKTGGLREAVHCYGVRLVLICSWFEVP